MVDVCVPIDIACCLCAQYERREGNEEPQGCCKKFWLPMTSVVDATGYDNYSDIAYPLLKIFVHVVVVRSGPVTKGVNTH